MLNKRYIITLFFVLFFMSLIKFFLINRDFSSNNELFFYHFNEFKKFKIVHEDTILYFNKNTDLTWRLNNTFKVNSKAMFYFENVFNHLNNAKTVLSDSRMHSKFDLDDNNYFVELEMQDGTVETIYIGKPSVISQSNYFKLNKESNVYITTVNLMKFFSYDFNFWVDKTIFNHKSDTIKQLDFFMQTGFVSYQKNNQKWFMMMNDDLSDIDHTEAIDQFLTAFSPMVGNEVYSITDIEPDSLEDVFFKLRFYLTTDYYIDLAFYHIDEKQYYIRSTEFPELVFKLDNILFDKLFKD